MLLQVVQHRCDVAYFRGVIGEVQDISGEDELVSRVAIHHAFEGPLDSLT